MGLGKRTFRMPAVRHVRMGDDPPGTRTPNPLIKSQLLCQIELVGPLPLRVDKSNTGPDSSQQFGYPGGAVLRKHKSEIPTLRSPIRSCRCLQPCI